MCRLAHVARYISISDSQHSRGFKLQFVFWLFSFFFVLGSSQSWGEKVDLIARGRCGDGVGGTDCCVGVGFVYVVGSRTPFSYFFSFCSWVMGVDCGDNFLLLL